jgi:hypothetical protein
VGPTQLPAECVSFFLGVKRPGREGNRYFPSSAEVKNGWSYTSSPTICFIVWKVKTLSLLEQLSDDWLTAGKQRAAEWWISPFVSLCGQINVKKISRDIFR